MLAYVRLEKPLKFGRFTPLVINHLTVMLDMGQEPMSVARVRRLSLSADLLTLETHKGDRVYTSAQIRALKISHPDAGKLRGAGFTAQRS